MRGNSAVSPEVKEVWNQKEITSLTKKSQFWTKPTDQALHNEVLVTEEDVKEYLTARTVLDGFVDFTTSHGVTHIYKTKGVLKKVAWVILSIAALTFLAVHLWYVFTGYLANETSTDIEIKASRSLPFPAVTICNLNAIKVSQIPQPLMELIDNKKSDSLDGTDLTYSNLKVIERLREEISYKNDETKFSMGYHVGDMITYCSFNGVNCNMSESFWMFYDSSYGNCFVFNSGKIPGAKLKQSTSAGPLYGLSLVVDIGADEYMPFLVEEAGVQILIHNQTDMPFPSHYGFTASPGQATSLGLKKSVITRVKDKPRYGSCIDVADGSKENNAFFEKYEAEYSELACLKTCYQKELVDKCRCFDPDIPYHKSFKAFSSLNEANTPCHMQDTEQASCKEKVEEEFNSNKMSCADCHPLCNETRFEVSKSVAMFPADSYMSDFMSKLDKKVSNEKKQKYIEQWGDMTTAIRSNYLKLNIYYELLEYKHYQQTISYDDYQFGSDLGGVFGLWIGWSVLTFFEFIELLMDLFKYCCFSKASSQKS